jgi:hypothetical protein
MASRRPLCVIAVASGRDLQTMLAADTVHPNDVGQARAVVRAPQRVSAFGSLPNAHEGGHHG